MSRCLDIQIQLDGQFDKRLKEFNISKSAEAYQSLMNNKVAQLFH